MAALGLSRLWGSAWRYTVSGDIALRAFTGCRLFPMAAPTGGTILIVAWLVLAVAAIVASMRS